MESFDGRVSLVTGVSRGIGRAIAARLHEAGAQVVGTGRSANAAQQFERDFPGARFAVADVTDAEAMAGVARSVFDEFGRLDYLVCNAGVTCDRLMLRMGPEEWHRVVDTNLNGTYNTIHGALRYLMKSDAGAIVAISSVIGLTGNAGQSNYAASKAGIVALCRSVAKEMAGRGLRVNAIAPGLIDTEMTGANGLSEEMRAAYLESIPMRRAGTAREIADVACFLLSSQASYITGQVIGVNGGLFP